MRAVGNGRGRSSQRQVPGSVRLAIHGWVYVSSSHSRSVFSMCLPMVMRR